MSKVKLIACLILALVVFSGCGGSDNNDGGGTETETDKPGPLDPPVNNGNVPVAGLFRDANLQACIDDVAIDQNLTDARANQLTGIVRCQDLGITDLSGVNNLVGIHGLVLNGNNISDLRPLTDMTNLTSLLLSRNNITDITSLSSLLNLVTLLLEQNEISSIDSLSGLSKLVILRLNSNDITDVSALSGISTLVDLDLSHNLIINVGPLASLTNLTGLSLHNNNIGGMGIGNIVDLVALTNLDTLRIFSNLSISCSELQTLITTFSGITFLAPTTAVDGTDCTAP